MVPSFCEHPEDIVEIVERMEFGPDPMFSASHGLVMPKNGSAGPAATGLAAEH